MDKAENKKLLSRTDLFSMAVGQIIGVGIMTMTGIAIGFTGRSVNFAYIVAGLITIFFSNSTDLYWRNSEFSRGTIFSDCGAKRTENGRNLFVYTTV